MKHLFARMGRYKKESILGPLFKLLEAGFDLCVPLVVAALIDQGIEAGSVPTVWVFFSSVFCSSIQQNNSISGIYIAT